MNEEEQQYLPWLKAALEGKGYPADAVQLILESPWAAHVIGDSWRNHVPVELAQSHFQRRWLIGPMRCYWLWTPGTELEKLPQDVTTRSSLTMKARVRLVEIHCPSCGRYWHDPDNNVAREELCRECKEKQPQPVSSVRPKKPSR